MFAEYQAIFDMTLTMFYRYIPDKHIDHKEEIQAD